MKKLLTLVLGTILILGFATVSAKAKTLEVSDSFKC